jgi:hypothetical protein
VAGVIAPGVPEGERSEKEKKKKKKKKPASWLFFEFPV